MYTAIVSIIHTHKPELPYEIKEIICLLDTEPILRYPQLKFWEWISSYYMACMGDVYQAAVPAGMKLESETLVCINPDFEAEAVLNDKEQRILDALSDGRPCTVEMLNKATEINSVLPTLKLLLEKNAIEVSESLTEKFRIKTESFVRLNDKCEDEAVLRSVFDELNRAKKQLDLLMNYIELVQQE